MDGLLNFLANYYIWFAGASVFFLFALIGLIYESKKKKKEEKNTADAVAQPITASPEDQPKEGVVVASETPKTEEVVAAAPSLEGLEGNTDSFSELEQAGQQQTLVIDDTESAPSAEPTLVIEDPSAQPAAPEVAPQVEAPAAAPEQSQQTLGNPGQPPV